jgi:drug/metabolite transporter (DMT)-like permease
MGTGGSQAVFGLSAAAIWGAADFSGGLAAKRASPPFVVAVAHGFSLILLLAAAFLLHTVFSGYCAYGLMSGVFCGAGLIALYSALSRGSMGLLAALSGVLTAIVPVVYSLVREARLHQNHSSPKRLIGFAVAAAAIWLVSYAPEPQTPSDDAAAHSRRSGLGLAAFAGLCFGLMLILMHQAATQGVLRALIAMRITSTAVAASAGIMLWFSQRRRGSSGLGIPAGKLLLLALLAGVLDTSGNLLYLFASLAGRLDVAAVLSSLYPAGTMLLAAWLLKERATRSQAAGMVLALAAIVLIST